MKKYILRIDGVFLAVMGTVAARFDLVSYFTGKGPFGQAYYQNGIAIGGFEAHCLAVIAGLTLILRSKSSEAGFFNKVAAAIHTVLGISNLIWFKVFFETGTVPMGYATTIAHFTFVFLNIVAIYRTDKIYS